MRKTPVLLLVVGSPVSYLHKVFALRDFGPHDSISPEAAQKAALLQKFFNEKAPWSSSITVAGNEDEVEELQRLCEEQQIDLHIVFQTASELNLLVGLSSNGQCVPL